MKWWILAALGTSAFAGVFVSAGQVPAAALAAALAAGSYLAGRRFPAPAQSRAVPADEPDAVQAPSPARPDSTALAAVGEEILPIWDRHVECARLLAQEEIGRLSTRFAGLSQRLGAAAETSARTADDASVAAIFAESRAELATVVDALRATAETRSAVLERVRGLAEFANDMKAMAEQVAKIAAQTNLLALNAAIEAARAGQSGAGFAVVAGQVRELSQQSAEAGKQIAEKVEAVVQAMESTHGLVEEMAGRDRDTIAHSEQTIEKVLQDLERATEGHAQASAMLREESAGIQAELADVLVALQFEDRLNQMLSQVRQSIGELIEAIRQVGDGESLDTGKLLASMQRSYTMDEQRCNHGPSAAPDADADAEDSSITFF